MSQSYEQDIVETMGTLVTVVQDLHKSAGEFLSGSHRNIIYQKISEDWNFLDDGVFAVRIYLLSKHWLVKSHQTFGFLPKIMRD